MRFFVFMYYICIVKIRKMKKTNNLPTILLPKGRLYEGIHEMYSRKGISLPDPNSRQYWFPRFFDDCNLFIAKPKAIPGLMSAEVAEFGFCGLDVMMNSEHYDLFDKLYDTQLNKVNLVIASKDNKYSKADFTLPLVVATEFETLAGRIFTDSMLPHYVLNSYGSTEGYVEIGADVIFDVVETGKTLAANGLSVDVVVMESTTCLYAHRRMGDSVLPGMISTLFD